MKINRKQVYEKCKGHCAYCGLEIKIKDMQVDHVISQRNFKRQVTDIHLCPSFLQHLDINDVDHVDNLMPSCRSCNNYKDVFHLEQFRSELSMLVGRLSAYSSIYRISKRFGMVEETGKPIQFYFEKQ